MSNAPETVTQRLLQGIDAKLGGLAEALTDLLEGLLGTRDRERPEPARVQAAATPKKRPINLAGRRDQ